MRIQGVAPWHGSGIKLAQERLVVKTYGLRKVFEGFWLTIIYVFYFAHRPEPQERRNTRIPNVFTTFLSPREHFLSLLTSFGTPLKTQALFMLLELGGVRKRPAESGIGFCLAPARAWLYPAPFPASQCVRHSVERTSPHAHGKSQKCVFSGNMRFPRSH